jgi:hypothetical protein
VVRRAGRVMTMIAAGVLSALGIVAYLWSSYRLDQRDGWRK